MAMASARSLLGWRAKWLVLALVCAVSPACAWSQTSLLPGAKPAATTQPATQPDALGRETPRGTVKGFIRAAQDENYETAAEYFQPQLKGRHHETPVEERELAIQLLAILNQGFGSSLDSISDKPEGQTDAGLPPDQEVVGGTRGLSESFPIDLVRMPDEHGNKLWFISHQTLAQVPEVYDSLRFVQIEKRIPVYLVKHRPVGMPLWQWLAIVIFAPIALAIGWLAAWVGRWGWQRYLRARGIPPATARKLSPFGPEPLLVGAIVHYGFVAVIGTSILYRQYYQTAIWVFLAFAFYWMVTRITESLSQNVWMTLTNRGRLAERSLVPLTRRVLDVVLFIFIALLVLRTEFGWDVTAALAGLGIGGLAIGLGAQKTFENLIGGIAILTDKAILVGDPCRIGDQSGTVEDIGLRSTKLRTEARTIVSIPNGTVATAVLENFRVREKILFRQTVRLRYDLTGDHLRYVIEDLRRVLASNKKVETGTWRVRMLKFGDAGIETEIYGYVMDRDYGVYLEVQEQVMLEVMDSLERTGGAVAVPSQQTVVSQDKWIDPEKAATAQREMDKARLGKDGDAGTVAKGSGTDGKVTS
jgi:MscS family membrane protein